MSGNQEACDESRGELLVRDVGNGEAELTLDLAVPWPKVIALLQVLDPSSRSSGQTELAGEEPRNV